MKKANPTDLARNLQTPSPGSSVGNKPVRLPTRLHVVKCMAEQLLRFTGLAAHEQQANRTEILGSLLTATLQVIKVILAESTSPEVEFANRAEMTKAIERLWRIAAGEVHHTQRPS